MHIRLWLLTAIHLSRHLTAVRTSECLLPNKLTWGFPSTRMLFCKEGLGVENFGGKQWEMHRTVLAHRSSWPSVSKSGANIWQSHDLSKTWRLQTQHRIVKNNSGFSWHAVSPETKPQHAYHSVSVFNPALTCRETQSASGDSPLCLLTY